MFRLITLQSIVDIQRYVCCKNNFFLIFEDFIQRLFLSDDIFYVLMNW